MPVRVTEIVRFTRPELVGFGLDAPRAAEGYDLSFEGWALGPDGPPSMVRVRSTGTPCHLLDDTLAAFPPLLEVPDVAERMPGIPRAAQSGFTGTISLVGLPLNVRLLVEVRLGSSWVPLAELQVAREPVATDPSGLRPVLCNVPGRSGSTWLMTLLGQHPEGVTYRPFQHEPRVDAYWMEAFRALADPLAYSRAIDPDLGVPDWWVAARDRLTQNRLTAYSLWGDPELKAWLTGPAIKQLATFCRARIEGFYEALAKQDGKAASFFAERTVSDRLTALSRELCPATREIMVVRDPRDILASRLSFMAKTGVLQFGRLEGDTDEDYVRHRFAPAMQYFTRQWEEARGRALLVKYEDLLMEPKATLQTIFEHIRVDASPETVERVLEQAHQRRPEWQEQHKTTRSERESIGRWRRDLDPQLLNVCVEALGDTPAKLGYADSSIAAS